MPDAGGQLHFAGPGILILPIFTMLIGGVVMVLPFDFFMVGTVRFNIYGSPVGTCLCYAITCCPDLLIVSGGA